MIALELEVMAKKLDRFGWERDRNTHTHDRLVMDWMDALQDFTLEEVRAACRKAVQDNPNKMPNEGHVVSAIMAERKAIAARNVRDWDDRHSYSKEWPTEEEKQRAAEIVAKAFPGIGAKWAEYKQHVAKE
jgi:hypothetical protein